jgi:hypothetical protein
MHIHKVIRLFSPRRAAASYVYSFVVTTPPLFFFPSFSCYINRRLVPGFDGIKHGMISFTCQKDMLGSNQLGF